MRLRKLIKDRGTTITALAKELGISRQAVSQYADGTGQPNIDKLVLIAKFFGVSTDYLSGVSEYQKVENEFVLAKDLGLSEKAIDTLKFFADFPEYPSFISTINYLIEQEVPPPNCSDNSDSFERELEKWEGEHCPVMSAINDFLSIENSQTKYDLTESGEILKKLDGKGLQSIRLDAFHTVQAKDIVEKILLSRIEERLKKLKRRKEIIEKIGGNDG